jgi:hypothetical protein
MWLVIDTLELSGTSDNFPDNTDKTIKTTNHTINIFLTLCDHCPYYFRLPRSGSDNNHASCKLSSSAISTPPFVRVGDCGLMDIMSGCLFHLICCPRYLPVLHDAVPVFRNPSGL